MRILFITQYFWPEVGAPQARLQFQAEHLAARGHDVHVLTTMPNYPTGKVEGEYRDSLWSTERRGQVEIHRVRSYASPKRTFLRRLWTYLSFACAAVVRGLPIIWRNRFDVVFVEVPPLFLAPVGLGFTLLRSPAVVFQISDLWIDALKDFELVRSRFLIRVLSYIETSMYQRASRIITVTEGLASRLGEKGLKETEISVIRNGVDVNTFRPLPGDVSKSELRSAMGITARHVVIYAGNHGHMHGLETFVHAAARRDAPSNCLWLFLGDGVDKEMLISLADEKGLTDKVIRFLDPVSHDELVRFLWASDVGIASWRDLELSRSALSVKVPMYMACALPVLFSGRGITQDVVEESGGGKVVEPEDPSAVVREVKELLGEPTERTRMGMQGRKYVSRHFSRRVQADQLEAVFKETVENREGQLVGDQARREGGASEKV